MECIEMLKRDHVTRPYVINPTAFLMGRESVNNKPDYGFMSDTPFNTCNAQFKASWDKHYRPAPNSDRIICQQQVSPLTKKHQLVFKRELALSGQSNDHPARVEYAVHRHATWGLALSFSLHDLPAGYNAYDLETAYKLVVPENDEANLKKTGVGGKGVINLTVSL